MDRQTLDNIIQAISFNPSCIDNDWQFKIQQTWYPITAEMLVFNNEKTTGPISAQPAGFLVTPSFMRPDTDSGEMERGWGGSVFIPMDADETRAIMKIWQSVEAMIRHELMEAFCYKGKRVFNPHKTIQELVWPEVLE